MNTFLQNSLSDLFGKNVEIEIKQKNQFSVEYLLHELKDFSIEVADDEFSSFHSLRKKEFLLSRFLYKKIMNESFNINVNELKRSSERMPVAPIGFCLSVSHDQDFVIVAVSKILLGVGVDIEKIGRIKPRVENHILAPNDNVADLLESSTLDRESVLALIFSAKESLYKLLFPFVRKYFGFMSAYVCSIDNKSNTFVIALNESLANEKNNISLEKGDRFIGKFLIYDDRVITYIEICK